MWRQEPEEEDVPQGGWPQEPEEGRRPLYAATISHEPSPFDEAAHDLQPDGEGLEDVVMAWRGRPRFVPDVLVVLPGCSPATPYPLEPLIETEPAPPTGTEDVCRVVHREVVLDDRVTTLYLLP